MSQPTDPDEISQLARQNYQAERFQLAASEFSRAAEAYAARSDELNAAEARNNESVAWLQAGLAEKAVAAVQGTPEIFEQAGDHHRAGQALGNLGAALAELGRSNEAETAYTQAVERLQRANDSEALSHTLKALSQIQLQSGRPMQAVTSMQRGMEQQRSFMSRMISWVLQLPSRFFPG